MKKIVCLSSIFLEIILSSIFIISCNDDSNDLTKSIPDPEGTITVNMRNIDNGGTRVEPDSCCTGFFIDDDNNFYCNKYYKFVSVGKVNGLGNIETIPTSGWAEKVAVEPGYGYVASCPKASLNDKNLTYVRICVVSWIESTSGGIIGAVIKYQSPFKP